MNFQLSNLKLSNDKNIGLYDHLEGLAEYIQEFYLSKKTENSYYTNTKEIHFRKIKNHISFNILDLKSEDKMSGMAMLNNPKRK